MVEIGSVSRAVKLDWQPEPIHRQILFGVMISIVAVALRYWLPLDAQVLPTITVVIAICLSTVLVGLWAGVTTMIVGGVLSWRLILSPGSWRLGSEEAIMFAGYMTVALVILATSGLYRRSEARRTAVRMAQVEKDALDQRMFAAEMSHRLKNSLAIVQSLSLQTFPTGTPELAKFSGRLTDIGSGQQAIERRCGAAYRHDTGNSRDRDRPVSK